MCKGPGRQELFSLPLKYFLEEKEVFFSKKEELNMAKKKTKEKKDK